MCAREFGFPYLCRRFAGSSRRGSPAYTGPCRAAGDQGATDLECSLIPTTVEGGRGLLCSRKASQLVATMQGGLIGLLSPQSPRVNAAYPFGPSRKSGSVLPYLAEQFFDAVTRGTTFASSLSHLLYQGRGDASGWGIPCLPWGHAGVAVQRW